MNLFNKRVLVTGGAGFVGSSLVRSLVSEGSNVFVYDDFSKGSIFNLDEVENQIEIIEGSIFDSQKIDLLMRENNIDFVFHLVADPFIPDSFNNPRQVIEKILVGTKNLIEISKMNRIERFLFLSSAEIYGNFKYIPIDENHPTNPLSAYAYGKLMADRLCIFENQLNDFPVVVARLFNTFGPRETHPYIIPEIISQLSSHNSFISIGNTRSRRSFTFIDDAVKALILLLKNRKTEGQVFNIGSDKSYSVKELVDIIGSLMGIEDYKILLDKERLRPTDPTILECDYQKIERLTGWKPRTSIGQGLQHTIDWFNKNGKKWSWSFRKLASVV